MKVVLLFVVLALALSSVPVEAHESGLRSPHSIVSGLLHTMPFGDGLFHLRTAIPTTVAEATAEGYHAASECAPSLGVKYTKKGDPLSLYFTEASQQICGLETEVYGNGAAPENLVKKGLWKPTENGHAISLTFIDGAKACGAEGPAAVDGGIFDRVVVNHDTIAASIPLTARDARKAGFTPGSCLNTMGTHYFYDFQASPKMSYEEDQLLPLSVMYYPQDLSGVINSVFFTTPVVQENILSWDTPNGLTVPQMCGNWCDDKCGLKTSWSTMHIYFNSNRVSLKCHGGPDGAPLGRSCKGLDTDPEEHLGTEDSILDRLWGFVNSLLK